MYCTVLSVLHNFDKIYNGNYKVVEFSALCCLYCIILIKYTIVFIK